MGSTIEKRWPHITSGLLLIIVGIVMVVIGSLMGPTNPTTPNWCSIAGALCTTLGLVWAVLGIIIAIARVLLSPFRRSRNVFYTKIRGVTKFREAVSEARVGDELLFRLERGRDGSIKGVAIHHGITGEQLGRFSRDRYPGIADQMLRGAVMTAKIKNVTGGGEKETGLNIEVHLVRTGQGPQSEANLSEFALGEA
jgi:hypothetical protein